MAGMTSLRKGKVGEREAAKAIQEHIGIAARRGQQYAGGPDSPDIVADLPGVHIEVKRTERFNAYQAMDQAKTDAAEGEIPLVLHRKNRREWLAIVPLEHLQALADTVSGKVTENV